MYEARTVIIAYNEGGPVNTEEFLYTCFLSLSLNTQRCIWSWKYRFCWR